MSILEFDRLHSVRNDLRALLHADVARAAPVLCTMAALSWLITVAIIFPPGTWTVKNKMFVTQMEQALQSFLGEYLGNGSYGDAMGHLSTRTFAWHQMYVPSKSEHCLG